MGTIMSEDNMRDDEQLAIANEVLELLRKRGIEGGAAVTILASVIIAWIEHLAADPHDAVVGTQAIATDMVEIMKKNARTSAN